MEQVLHGMHDDRAIAAFDVENTFDSQYLAVTELSQPIERRGDAVPVERRVEAQAEGPDAVVV